jgi:hypothetical protein
MDAEFTYRSFTDAWLYPSWSWFSLLVRHRFSPLRAFLSTAPREIREFENYVLGFRWKPTERELRLIQKNGLWSHVAIPLHHDAPAITFADVLGPEFVPEVNPSHTELLRSEGRIRAAALSWTRRFEMTPD